MNASSAVHDHHSILNLIDLLRYRAAATANTFTFLDPAGAVETIWTSRDLLRHSFGVAQALHELEPGSRVGIVHPAGLAYASAFFGAIAAGMIPVPIYPPDRAALERTLPRLEAIVRNAGVRAILTSRSTDALFDVLADKSPLLAQLPRIVSCELAAVDDDGRPGPAAEDVAFLQYTSGSTETPRGVRVTHANLLHNSRLIETIYQNRPGTTGVTWLPPYHDMGLIGGIVQPVQSGMDVVMMSPSTFVRRPLRWLQAISTYRARLSAAPNFAFAWCARRVSAEDLATLDLSSWEVAVCGAEPIRADVVRGFADKFGPAGFRADALTPSYGLAEATLLVTGTRLRAGLQTLRVDADALSRNLVQPCDSGGRELVSCGPAAPDVKLGIVDPESGQECEGVGEILVGGPSVARGYHEAPAETAHSFTQRGLRTGDLGFVHEGQLYVVGRRKELMIVRGRNFHPHDLEATARAQLPALHQAHIVAGTFDDEGSALPAILVEAVDRNDDHDRTVTELQAAIRHAFSIAIEAVVVAKGSIFRTSSGKLERRRSLAALRDGSLRVYAASPELEGLLRVVAPTLPPDSPVPELDSIQQHLAETLAALLRIRVRDLDPQLALPELGLDSLAAAELRAQIFETYQVEIELSPMAGTTLRELGLRVAHARKSAAGEAPGEPSWSSRLRAPRAILARPSLFFFADGESPDESRAPTFAALERAVRFADEAGFEAVWLPERCGHGAGASIANAAVLAAALAVQTSQIQLRAGRLMMPLEDPRRVVEDWSMVDRLSAGRVALSFTSGSDARDCERRPKHETSAEGIEKVRRLWRGDPQAFADGRSFVRPVQRELSVWLTCDEALAFEEAGRRGFNLLTTLVGQDDSRLSEHIAIYRQARADAGHDRGHVTLAVHTYVGETAQEAQASATASPLASPAGLEAPPTAAYPVGSLVGSLEECAARVRSLSELGVDELACLTDFGVTSERAYAGLQRLATIWEA